MRALSVTCLLAGLALSTTAPLLSRATYEWQKLYLSLLGLALIGVGVGVALLTTKRPLE